MCADAPDTSLCAADLSMLVTMAAHLRPGAACDGLIAFIKSPEECDCP
jgi:hypothetical protein